MNSQKAKERRKSNIKTNRKSIMIDSKEIEKMLPFNTSINAYSGSIRKRSRLLHSYEDAFGHWGIQLKMSSVECACCHLSISICKPDNIKDMTELQQEKIMSSLVTPVLVFSCGHLFHRACVPDLACGVCFQQSFQSVLKNA